MADAHMQPPHQAQQNQAPHLTQEPNEVDYSRMVSRWPRDQYVRVHIQGAVKPCSIPISFIAKSGVNTWKLVADMVGFLVNEKGRLVSEVNEVELDLAAKPTAGDVQYIPLNASEEFTWARGPQGAVAGKIVVEGEGDERSSISAASTTQAQFREMLVGRDNSCLVSEWESFGCQAAHIIPKKRTDILTEILGPVGESSYEACMGLLLRNDLYTFYDRYTWSLYPEGDTFFVHVFANQRLANLYHGKAIPPTRFSAFSPEGYRPLPELCRWHYQQCCMMHLRGFSAHMAQNAT